MQRRFDARDSFDVQTPVSCSVSLVALTDRRLAPWAVFVGLRAVWIGLQGLLPVDPGAGGTCGGVGPDRMAVRVRFRTEILRQRGGRGENKRPGQDQLFHSEPSVLVCYGADTTTGSRRCRLAPRMRPTNIADYMASAEGLEPSKRKGVFHFSSSISTESGTNSAPLL